MITLEQSSSKVSLDPSLLASRGVASAHNIDILSGTHERISIFKIRASIGSHFKISHKNIAKNIKCLKYQ